MQIFKRFGYFILTNILVLVTIGIAWSLISHFMGLAGFNQYLPTMLAFCFVWGMGGAFISLMMSKFAAKHYHGVKIIDTTTTQPELRQLLEKVHDLARRAKLPKMPEVGVYESYDVNAFATGPSKKNSLIAVSTGLLQRMNDKEIEGVLGHEVAHIANGDMVTMTLIQGVVNAFAMFFSRILANVIASNVDERYSRMVHFLCVIVGDIAFTLLGSIVVNFYSRKREFRADAGSARISSVSNMTAALRRLQSLHEAPPAADDAMATLKISGREKKGSIADLFMTHPALQDRINALERGRVA
ncbi:protease HtpX [Bdellovibrio sp. HCB337]|uniref:protease HtpX n=1 Tax=Bdellovibrio sp. HCB337 TaxID=3394358 RepID=UPI0039A5030F